MVVYDEKKAQRLRAFLQHVIVWLLAFNVVRAKTYSYKKALIVVI